MQTAIFRHSVQAPSQALSQSDIDELVEACHEQTAEALVDTRAASKADVSHAMEAVRMAQAQGLPLDLMEAIARVQVHQGEAFEKIIHALGSRLASIYNPPPLLIPFGGSLIAPSAFYKSFDHLHKLARALLAPVIFAEDTGSIGVASANPIAATLLAGKIQELVMRRFDIRPFLTIARLNFESWTFLTHRHFGL